MILYFICSNELSPLSPARLPPFNFRKTSFPYLFVFENENKYAIANQIKNQLYPTNKSINNIT